MKIQKGVRWLAHILASLASVSDLIFARQSFSESKIFFLASQLSRRTRAETLVTQAMRIQKQNTVERRYNERKGRETGRMFAIARFRYIKVHFHIFYHYWIVDYRSSHRGPRYLEVRYDRTASLVQSFPRAFALSFDATSLSSLNRPNTTNLKVFQFD